MSNNKYTRWLHNNNETAHLRKKHSKHFIERAIKSSPDLLIYRKRQRRGTSENPNPGTLKSSPPEKKQQESIKPARRAGDENRDEFAHVECT